MGDGRPLLEQTLIRWPWLARSLFRRVTRLPRSRLRHALMARTVNRALCAVNRRDLEVVALICAPDLTLRTVGFPVGAPDGARGLDGLQAFFDDWDRVLSWPEFTIRELTDLGDRILLKGSLVARGHLSGIETENNAAAAVAFLERGVVRELQFHWSHDTAVKAAKAAEPRKTAGPQ